MSDRIQSEYSKILNTIAPFLSEDAHSVFNKTGLSEKMFQLLCGHISELKFYVPKYENLGFRDFNKEIFHPNSDREHFPEGVVLIRSDDNFWIEAALPYFSYVDMDIKTICESFWPELKDSQVKYKEDKINT